VTAILDGWDWSDGACLVGGYAVSAYGRPRYSRDLDFVIPASSKERTLGHLDEIGFSVRPLRKPDRLNAFRDSITLKRDNISVDLMIGYVKDKSTQVSVSQEWISSRFREMRLILITGSTQENVRVCRPEALWVLKLIAGRNQDLGDLFAIGSEPIDVKEIRDFLAGVGSPALKARFEDEAKRLRSERIYAESLSARFLPTLSDTAKPSWARFKRRFLEITS